MEYWTAFSIGLVGSLHCLGMCGPIAFALPLDRKSIFSQWLGSFSYNFGRIFTYFLLGTVFGILGYGFSLAGFQRWVSIAVGTIMILSVLLPNISKKFPQQLSFYNLWIAQLKSALSQRFNRKSMQNLLGIGLLNGLLPCGLVYMGLAGATAMQHPINGGLFMAAFGLGTLPMMLSVAFYGNRLKTKLVSKSKKIIPVFIILIGALFILRGMNLGLPYLSPKIEQNAGITKCD